ncbi:CobW-like GTP-binding protein [Pseudomonas sp. RIT-PI-S]|uniref:CobW family GTP-binding protein n=1 Tax=Pseudomonas sp. RIT-PI-S TaxID=3035295 RepID=UPI0021DA2B64|nr:CobW-like GTP-binding protein [Pseudomonas sp. RIT-PI-S]
MFKNIPTYVLAGPLGAGKTTVVQHWLRQRPAAEHWAVMVNEFGDIGLDAALLQADTNGIAVAQITGGCVCCVNGAPFTVALSRLIRSAKPDRLLIELSGLSHPQMLFQQLQAAPWAGVLDLQPLVVVLDGLALREGGELPGRVQAALTGAYVLVINKADAVPADQRAAVEHRIGHPGLWITQGQLDWLEMSTSPADPTPPARPHFRPASTALLGLERGSSPEQAWSIGWCAAPEQLIDLEGVEAFLKRWPWARAKMIIHSPQGWQSANVLAGHEPKWRPSEWRRDSRLELIFSARQSELHAEQLAREWEACLLAL